MRKRMVLGLFTLTVVLAASSLGVAQTVTAKLSGILTDETDGVLLGAQITIKNL